MKQMLFLLDFGRSQVTFLSCWCQQQICPPDYVGHKLMLKIILLSQGHPGHRQERGHMAQLEETPLPSGDQPHRFLDEPAA